MTIATHDIPQETPARSVEELQARAQALGRDLDAFIVERVERLHTTRRHALEDARTALLQVDRYFQRAQERRTRKRAH